MCLDSDAVPVEAGALRSNYYSRRNISKNGFARNENGQLSPSPKWRYFGRSAWRRGSHALVRRVTVQDKRYGCVKSNRTGEPRSRRSKTGRENMFTLGGGRSLCLSIAEGRQSASEPTYIPDSQWCWCGRTPAQHCLHLCVPLPSN